jgi:glutamate--cysteine ligase
MTFFSINKQAKALHLWLDSLDRKEDLPLYSSVDIRDAGFKVAVVDTNLFPAGFNNLCKTALDEAKHHFLEAIQSRVPGGKRILMVTEEHTRNTWYLENVYVLKEMMIAAGFNVCVASFLDAEPQECDEFFYLDLLTAKDNSLRMHCLKHVMSKMGGSDCSFDLIVLNNDLTTGIPDLLKESDIPIYPSLASGWHSRLKSHHFEVANRVLADFALEADIDPWLVSCLFEKVNHVDINDENDRQRLYTHAKKLFGAIQIKYEQYDIKEKPFIFLKADSGTYGMGVKAIESPEDILDLNRKARNNLSKGKSAQKIGCFLLQEGVPTVQHVGGLVGEVCIYQIANHFAGGFYRVNDQKSTRDNLNSKGMSFKKMCVCPEQEDCGVSPDTNLDLYRLLARVAGVAAHREIKELEAR